METVVEVKETAMAGPKHFGMIYENRTLALSGLTPEAADVVAKIFTNTFCRILPRGKGEYGRWIVAFPIDRIGFAAFVPEREEFGQGTVYRGPAMILKTADLSKGVIIIGVRTPVKWLPASAPYGKP